MYQGGHEEERGLEGWKERDVFHCAGVCGNFEKQECIDILACDISVIDD